MGCLDVPQRIEARDSGHIPVEDYEVESLLGHKLYGIGSAVAGGDVITLGCQKYYMGLEKIYLVIGPENLFQLSTIYDQTISIIPSGGLSFPDIGIIGRLRRIHLRRWRIGVGGEYRTVGVK